MNWWVRSANSKRARSHWPTVVSAETRTVETHTPGPSDWHTFSVFQCIGPCPMIGVRASSFEEDGGITREATDGGRTQTSDLTSRTKISENKVSGKFRYASIQPIDGKIAIQTMVI